MPSKKNIYSCCNNIGLNIDSDLCFEKMKVAEKFNRFNTTIASDLVSKRSIPSFKFGKRFVTKFYSDKGVHRNSFFSLVTENKVLKATTYG